MPLPSILMHCHSKVILSPAHQPWARTCPVVRLSRQKFGTRFQPPWIISCLTTPTFVGAPLQGVFKDRIWSILGAFDFRPFPQTEGQRGASSILFWWYPNCCATSKRQMASCWYNVNVSVSCGTIHGRQVGANSSSFPPDVCKAGCRAWNLISVQFV